MRLPALALLAALAAVPGASRAALDVSGIDKAVDPCSDLFAYVNRRWIEATPIPDDQSSWGAFAMLRESNERALATALDEAARQPHPVGSSRWKVARYYASGMDLDAIARAGLRPLDPHFARIAAIASPADLPAAMAHLQSHGIDAPMQFTVRQDARDSSRYIPELHQSGLGLPERDAYFRDDEKSKALRDAYRRHLARLLALAGDPEEVAAKHAAIVLDLETELARASMTPVERRDVDKTYNKRSATELSAQAPGLDWTRYLTALGVRELRELNVAQPRFAKAVAMLAHSRPVSEWRAYLRAHLLKAAAARLAEPFAHAAFEYEERLLRGVKARPPRAREVMTIIGGRYGREPMAQAMGQIFVEKAFSAQARARALEAVANVKAALGERIRGLEWMGPETRAHALEKLAAMNVKIGYPEKWPDYTAADVGPYAFAENWLRANSFRHHRDLQRIGRPVDRMEWSTSPHIVNAFYNGRFNEIVFPAAILQPPFFDARADDAVNYGGIGMVIGHEITHGFDDRGRRFDAKGNLRDWWSAEDARRYLARAQRIERQFAAFRGVDGIAVDGKLTLGENISDLGGLKIAYLGLQKALEGKPRTAVDGFTPEQRFFLSFASVWRSRYRDEYERLLLRTDGHSPPRFRVNGPIAQMPEFARAFSCDPSRTVLAEELRAELW
jgi:putative endopeptidase